MAIKYKNHPLIKGLRISEDGMSIEYKGNSIKVHKYFFKHSQHPQYRVNLLCQTISVQKLVCEAWNGLRPDSSYCSERVKDYDSIHYTNLKWLKCGTNILKTTKNRSKLSKIKPEDIEPILKRIKKGETNTAIAKDYNTSSMSITRLKKKIITNGKTK